MADKSVEEREMARLQAALAHKHQAAGFQQQQHERHLKEKEWAETQERARAQREAEEQRKREELLKKVEEARREREESCDGVEVEVDRAKDNPYLATLKEVRTANESPSRMHMGVKETYEYCGETR
mmetsp:Transcript_5402/g.13585  ORF Transcript_5402/g.13585 Transcript_5402/m.13585 type:complete len:126 (-) Transcript_5402:7-384(-)